MNMAVSTLDNVNSFFNTSVRILANTNMNDYTTPGIYRCSGADAATLTNKPTANAFVMFVISRSPLDGIERNQIVFSPDCIFIRGTASGSFTGRNWYKFTGTEMT